jgi:hypothetical protein
MMARYAHVVPSTLAAAVATAATNSHHTHLPPCRMCGSSQRIGNANACLRPDYVVLTGVGAPHFGKTAPPARARARAAKSRST